MKKLILLFLIILPLTIFARGGSCSSHSSCSHSEVSVSEHPINEPHEVNEMGAHTETNSNIHGMTIQNNNHFLYYTIILNHKPNENENSLFKR